MKPIRFLEDRQLMNELTVTTAGTIRDDLPEEEAAAHVANNVAEYVIDRPKRAEKEKEVSADA
jgi:hypothetical protein